LSVPLVGKLRVTLVDGSTLPLPDTVVWMTPSVAWTVSVEVRAVLAGGPISVTASAITPIAIRPRTYKNQGLTGLSRRLLMSIPAP
jgi:hypothetical protein